MFDRGYIRCMGKHIGKQRIVSRNELIAIARTVVEQSGGQRAAARLLGVSQASLWQSLQDEEEGMLDLRQRILEELGGYQVLDDHFAIIEPTKRSTRGDPG